MDTVRTWSEKTEIALKDLLGWAELHSSTFNNWTRSYGRAYAHNAKVPRDHWLTDGENQAIVRFYHEHPLNGYRRLTYMMLDADIVACSPTAVHRVLSSKGLLSRFGRKTSQKGNGFDQPNQAHQHLHIDVSHLNICGTFYFCASIFDGYSRMIVHWDIRPETKEIYIEAIVQERRNFTRMRGLESSVTMALNSSQKTSSHSFVSAVSRCSDKPLLSSKQWQAGALSSLAQA